MFRHAVDFKQCWIGTKRAKVCQENISHTIKQPAAWTTDTKDSLYKIAVYIIFCWTASHS